MKKQAMFSSALVSTEEFIELPASAQAFYFHLLCDTQTDGEVINPRMIARAKGFTQADLDTLFEHGYLLECCGKCYVRHHWQNNKFSSKAWESMRGCEPYRNGMLVFEGDEGHSAYMLVTQDTTECHPGDTKVRFDDSYGVAGESRNGNGNGNGNGTEQEQVHSYGVGVGVSGGGEGEHHPCQCSRCGSQATYTGSGAGNVVIHCPHCGDFVYESCTSNQA